MQKYGFSLNLKIRENTVRENPQSLIFYAVFHSYLPYYLCIILRADAFALILFKILCYYVLTLASVNFKLKLQGMKIDRSSKIKMTNHKASNALLCTISRVTFLIARLCNVNILSCPMSSSN